MLPAKANIIARLQKEILSLQGFKPAGNSQTDINLGPINNALPNNIFPLGAIHEFICTCKEDAAATNGFITGIIDLLMQTGGTTLWISASRTVFPPALAAFGIAPDKIIFIDLQKERDVLWMVEEALKCEGLAAVIGEMKELNFIQSRRLQLAVETSRVTGFIVRTNPRELNVTACITRWQITSLPGIIENDMPGVGTLQWNIELLKVRNGKPGTWKLTWKDGEFNPVGKEESMEYVQQSKTG